MHLSDTWPTDAELANLAGLTRLEGLSSTSPGSPTRDSPTLLGMKSLTELRLDAGGPYSDSAMVYLSGMVRLSDLVLSNSRLTDAGIAHLRWLTKLTRLDLRSTQVTSRHRLSRRHEVAQELRLDTSGPLTDVAMIQIAGMSQLETLVLRGPGVTDFWTGSPGGFVQARHAIPQRVERDRSGPRAPDKSGQTPVPGAIELETHRRRPGSPGGIAIAPYPGPV